jgi:hypothetical protein
VITGRCEKVCGLLLRDWGLPENARDRVCACRFCDSRVLQPIVRGAWRVVLLWHYIRVEDGNLQTTVSASST